MSEHWRWPRRALRSRLLVAAASQRSGRQEGDRQRQTWLVELIELSASPPPSSVSQLPLCLPLSVAPPSLARQPDGMPIPAELQSLLSELNISPPTKEHAPVETVEALIAAVTDLDCSFSKNLLIKDKKAGQPGQSVRLWRRRSSPFTPPLGASGGSLRGVHSRGVQPGHRARRAPPRRAQLLPSRRGQPHLCPCRRGSTWWW